MSRYLVMSDTVTFSKVTKQGTVLPNNIRGKIIPAQSKKSSLAIQANVNVFTPVALINANSATCQNNKNFYYKNCREISQRLKILL